MKQYLFLLVALAPLVCGAQRAPYNERAAQYIRQYKDWAIAEQRRSGVPAAITLAQGVHETDAGSSELATMANNHFGIKCKKEWTGETFAHDDDAPQECFRKYNSALESYKDHSDYLKNSKRYQSCFALQPTDYAGWARELRRCGYATNPVYAQKLIKIIEDYHLQDYTVAALNPAAKPSGLIASVASPVEAAMMVEEKRTTPGEVVPDQDTPVDAPDYGKVIRKDGLRGFWAHKGDVLLEYAIQYKVRYAKLLEMNNLPDAPLAGDQFIYLEQGSKVERMMAKDVSTPVAPMPVTAPAAQETAAPASTTAAAAPAPSTETLTASAATPAAAPVTQTPVREMSAAEVAAAAEAKIFGETPKAVPAQSTPVEKPINIADEKAVEEQKPEEPQDEFSKLKARLDKVVYAPSRPSPAPAATLATANTSAPVTEKPVPNAAGTTYHIVKAGETAFGISKHYGITMQQLMDLNKLTFGSGIKVGQKLRVK